MLGLKETVDDLALRLECPDSHATAGRLTGSILDSAGAKSPLNMKANDFNKAAEKFYRNDLKRHHIRDAFRLLEEDMNRIDAVYHNDKQMIRNALQFTLKDQDASQFLSITKQKVMREEVSTNDLVKLINLTLISIDNDRSQSQKFLHKELSESDNTSSVYRA
jgi:hypothetical protein